MRLFPLPPRVAPTTGEGRWDGAAAFVHDAEVLCRHADTLIKFRSVRSSGFNLLRVYPLSAW